MQYTQDYDEILPLRYGANPPEYSWRAMVQPYIKSKAVFQCPDNPSKDLVDLGSDGYNPSYAATRYDTGSGGAFRDDANGPAPVALAAIQTPSSTLMVGESTARYSELHIADPSASLESPIGTANNTTQASGCLYTGHTGMANFLFCDTHVKAMHALATVGVDQGGSGASGVNMWTVDNSAFTSAADRTTAINNLTYADTKCH